MLGFCVFMIAFLMFAIIKCLYDMRGVQKEKNERDLELWEAQMEEIHRLKEEREDREFELLKYQNPFWLEEESN